MTHNWTTGDVAMVGGSIGIYEHHGFRRPEMLFVNADSVVARDARPLLVIDPEDREQVERVTAALFGEVGADMPDGYTANEVQAAIRSLIEPEPEEPTRFLAEVEDGRGGHWFRAYEHGELPWVARAHTNTNGMHLHHVTRAWSDLPRPITVLSEGWQEATDD